MRLEKLIDECVEALQEEACNDSGSLDSGFFCVCVNTNDGYIDIGYAKNKKGDWEAEVNIIHDNYSLGKQHSSPNVEKYIEDMLYDCVDWDAAEEKWLEDDMDEYQRNGFRDAKDFWNWKEGW